MRIGATFVHTTQISEMTAAEATTTAKATFSPPSTFQRSPWHSPVPYLFGGLAAMLGLIAFALLILACSYWKLNGGEGDVEGGAAGKGESGSDKKSLPVFEEKFLVIMAGEVKPTFLATPMSRRTASSDGEKLDNEEDGKEEDSEGDNQTTQQNGEAEAPQVSQHQSQ